MHRLFPLSRSWHASLCNLRPGLYRILLVSALYISPLAAQTAAVRGVVQDSSGAVIPDAIVHLTEDAFQASSVTDDRGVFSFTGVPADSGVIEVAKEGFQTLRRPISVGISAQDLVLTLEPASSGEQVVVSATRTDMRLSDSPGSTVLLSSVDITATPALRVDDVLRQVPGFSLFRRSSSRTANASAQGVSLRGLGGSASSRALVLADGISIVDPFGGWVYWSRVPRIALSSIEVFRGGDSNLYGSSALGGVVQLITRETESPAIALETSYGNERTPSLSLWAGGATGKWDYSTSAEMFRTDGFILVPDSVRGTVDTPANSEDATVYARIGHTLGNGGRVFLRGNFYTEFRNNGTPIQTNDTRIGEAVAGIDKRFGDDSLTLRLYGDVEGYNQRFSAIASDRSRETLTDIQHVPEQVVGGAAQWTYVMRKSQTFIAGLDLNEVIGASEEQLFTGANRQRDGGGRQRTFGLFGADIFHRANWTFLLAARLDDWSNFNGSLTTTPLSGPPSVTIYPNRQDLALSPRLSMLHSFNQRLSVTASVYRAFRAPTLNELYRTFRVGNVVTSNNASLTAERLTGAEAGLNFSGWQEKASLRGTFFWSDIVNPVANVTISSTPSLITRKKENLGRTRSRGVELDGVVRFNRDVQLSAGYAYTDATVVSYPGNPGGVNLTGLEIPQVPRNVFTWEARYWNPQRLMLSISGRFVGQQFDDDQNQLPLNRFYTMDATLGRSLTRHLDLYASAENILDQRYQVARTPVVNLGPPVLFRVGLRLSYPANK